MSLIDYIVSLLRSLFFRKHLEICVVGLQSAGKTSLVNVLSAGQFSTEVVATIGFSLKRIQSGNTTIKVWDIGGQARFRNMWERYCRGVSAIVFVVDSSLPMPGAAASKEAPASEAAPPSKEEGDADRTPTSSSGETDDSRTHKPKQPSSSSATAAWTDRAASTASTALSISAGANPWLIATDELHALLTRPQLSGIPLLVLATKNDLPRAAHVDDVIRVMRLDRIQGREVSCYSISSKNQVNIDVTLRWLCARSPLGAR